MKVMKRKNPLSDNLSRAKAVAKEGFRKTGHVRVGVLAERGDVEFELFVLNVNRAVGRKGLSVAGAAGRMNAIEHIDALSDHFEELGRGAQSHGVSRFVLRQKWLGILNRSEHFLFGLAHGDSTDGVSVEIEINKGSRGLFPKIRIDAALHDSEMKLPSLAAGRFVFLYPSLAALGPAGGEIGRFLSILPLTRVGRAFVEKHRNVRTEGCLNLHALLGTQHHLGTIKVTPKFHAGFGNLTDLGKGPDLKAARICEHGTVPSRKAVKSAEFRDHLSSGSQPEVIGVSENDLSIHCMKVLRMKGLNRALCADRHKDRGFDYAVGRGEPSPAGLAIGICRKKFEHQCWRSW